MLMKQFSFLNYKLIDKNVPCDTWSPFELLNTLLQKYIIYLRADILIPCIIYTSLIKLSNKKFTEKKTLCYLQFNTNRVNIKKKQF